MCGIVGGIQGDDIYPFLIEGLKRLEYRGYDSAGLAILSNSRELVCVKEVGKVQNLENAVNPLGLSGKCGIAHTRWATHGKVTQRNAHPHTAGNRVVVVHNGIIDDFEFHRRTLLKVGAQLSSETDSEVIPHLVLHHLEDGESLIEAVRLVSMELQGSYSFAAFDALNPNSIVVVRNGCPIVIGFSDEGIYFGSDTLALIQCAKRAMFLQDGDVAELSCERVFVINQNGESVNREESDISGEVDNALLDGFDHYMLKEIYQQPSIAKKLTVGWPDSSTSPVVIEGIPSKIINAVEHVHIISCGSSHNAALLAELWFERYCQVSCTAFIASEYRYNFRRVPHNTLVVAISQSGETADTLGALEVAKGREYLASIALCNSPGSSMTRAVDSTILLHAGKEIGVASTKAFIAQLITLHMLAFTVAWHKRLPIEKLDEVHQSFSTLESAIRECVSLAEAIKPVARELGDKSSCLFIGRGEFYPIAIEGALKLKEVSYIHAEAYPAGELKHGPLALVDQSMPTVVLAPKNAVLDKVKSNIEEIKARNGHVYILTHSDTGFIDSEGTTVIVLPNFGEATAPILFTVALQLLSYQVAIIRGMDVDRPRNLAKAVTVE